MALTERHRKTIRQTALVVAGNARTYDEPAGSEAALTVAGWERWMDGYVHAVLDLFGNEAANEVNAVFDEFMQEGS